MSTSNDGPAQNTRFVATRRKSETTDSTNMAANQTAGGTGNTTPTNSGVAVTRAETCARQRARAEEVVNRAEAA